MHLELHGTAAFKGVAGADDEREVMGAEFRVCVWGVGIRISSRCQNSAALYSGLLRKKNVR